MTVSEKNGSQGTKISRWGIVALPLSIFVGIVVGAGVGAAVAHIGIGVAVGAGFGVGVGVAVTVAIFVFRSSEPPGSQWLASQRLRLPPSGRARAVPAPRRAAECRGTT